MASGSSRGGDKSSPKGFKSNSDGKWPTVTVQPGQSAKVQLENIKQLSRDSMGTGGKLSKTKTVKPGDKSQLDNIKDWGSSKVRQGDNPFGKAK